MLMILFTKPKTEAGKGYLRVDRNMWYYDPTVGSGKWERLAGTIAAVFIPPTLFDAGMSLRLSF